MMNDKRPESVYVTGQRHMLWTIVAMFAIIWGIPLALSAFGASSQTMFAVIVPLGFAWVLIGGVRSFMIACPSCGKSLFMRGFIGVPWPAKRCSRCGVDLTITAR
jgi:ribosomal protein S27AE